MRTLIFFFLISWGASACAQIGEGNGYWAFGISYARFELGGLNRVVQEYNESRPWLDKECEEFGNLSGVRMEFGVIDKIYLDWGLNIRRQKNTSYGDHPIQGELTRNLKVRNINTNLTLGGMIPVEGGGLGIGLRGEISTIRMMERVYDGEGFKGIYQGRGNNFVAGWGPSLKLVLGEDHFMMFEVYYARTVPKANWFEVGNLLNPNTTSSEESDYDTSNNAIGVSVSFGGFFE